MGSTTWYRPLRPEGSETDIIFPLPPPLTLLLLMLPLLGLLVSPLLELECRAAASAAAGWRASCSPCAGCADDRDREGMIVCP